MNVLTIQIEKDRIEIWTLDPQYSSATVIDSKTDYVRSEPLSKIIDYYSANCQYNIDGVRVTYPSVVRAILHHYMTLYDNEEEKKCQR